MSVPGIVQSTLDGEQVAAEVSLGGEDTLFVTRTRTLVYRADGLLSDESVEKYSHDAERIAVSEGRRKSAIELDYGIDGTESFKVPSNRLYEALHPVLAGVLNAADVTGADETVRQTYQFSELTLVVTSERVVKHVGAAVWDEDYEEYHFDDVTALDVEEGNVSSQIIVETDGRPQRIKTPSEQSREVRERIQQALLSYHDADSYEEFAREHAHADDRADAKGDSVAEAERESPNDEGADPLAGGGVDPIDADPPELDEEGSIIDEDAGVTTDDRPGEAGASETETSDRAEATDAADASSVETEASAATAETAGGAGDGAVAIEEAETDGFTDSGFEPASSELEAEDTEAQLEALTEAVQRQNELLAEQQRTLEKLVEELSRGR